jgi:hypothetical protein
LWDEWEMAENRAAVGGRARNGNAGKRERGDPISNDE